MTDILINVSRYNHSKPDDVDNIIIYGNETFGTFRHPTQMSFWDFKRLLIDMLDFCITNESIFKKDRELDILLLPLLQLWRTNEEQRKSGVDIIPLEKFITDNKEGCLLDFDGTGYYGTSTERFDTIISWDAILSTAVRLKATHIWWYGK